MPPATTSGQAQQNLQSFGNSMQSPDQAVNAANTQFGVQQKQQQVQDLRQTLQNTEGLLNKVAPSVMGRTANSLVTDAQANRQIQNEQAPLNTQLNQENQQYSNANQDYTGALTQAQNMANATLTGQQDKLSYLQGVYNDLYTQEQNAAQLAAEKYAADRAASGSGGASPSFGNLGATGAGGAGGGGSMTRNAAGGYAFTNAAGQPVTMGQYLAAQGANPQQIIQQAANLLAHSGNGGDKGIANAISSGRYTPAQLEQLFPQVFGGNY